MAGTEKQLFEFEVSGDVLILTANGPFMEFRDNDIRNGYNEAYRLLCQPGTRHLVVDFSLLDYFGSTFVGILVRLARKARGNQGQALLCHLSDNMREMLKTLMLLENPKIDFSMQQVKTRADALQQLASAT
ncbi:MAG: STAS domain-containing protein [Planctomycetota bacterium]